MVFSINGSNLQPYLASSGMKKSSNSSEFALTGPPIEQNTPAEPIFYIYPNSMMTAKGSWLSCENRVGFEILEFQDPAYLSEGEGFHFCGIDHTAFSMTFQFQ